MGRGIGDCRRPVRRGDKSMTRIRVRCVTCGSPVVVDPVWINFAGVTCPRRVAPGDGPCYRDMTAEARLVSEARRGRNAA
jgi:hypothetical protein